MTINWIEFAHFSMVALKRISQSIHPDYHHYHHPHALVMATLYIREVLGLNPGWDTCYPNRAFSLLSQSLQENSGIVHRLGHHPSVIEPSDNMHCRYWKLP